MDNRRLILLLVFSFSLVMLWDAWQKQGEPRAVVAGAVAPASVATSGPPAASGAVPTPSAPGATGAGAVPVEAVRVDNSPKAVIKTDLFIAEISAQGGDLVRLELIGHPDSSDKTKHFVLFDNGGAHLYYGQSGAIGEGMPNHKTVWQLSPGEHALREGQNVIVHCPAMNFSTNILLLILRTPLRRPNMKRL